MNGHINVLVPYEGKMVMGGIASYIRHLTTLLEGADVVSKLYCMGKTKGNYTGVTTEQMIKLAKSGEPCLVPHIYNGTERYAEINAGLAASGIPLATQDIRVVTKELMNTWKGMFICTGYGLYKYMREYGKRCTYIPLPYARQTKNKIKKREAAFLSGVIATRVAKEKGIELVLEINTISPCKIFIKGLRDMRYINFNLSRKHPTWSRYYMGTYENALDAYDGYTFAVDFSNISTVDAGRTQYSFMEAMEAGVPLVIRKEWEANGRDEMVDGKNCIAIHDAQHFMGRLDEIIQADFSTRYAYTLKFHSENIAQMYMEVLQ